LVDFGFVADLELPLGSISSSEGSGSISSSNSVSGNSVSSNSMSSIANSSNGGSMSNTNWDMRDSVDGGSMCGHNSLAGVGLVCGVVDMGSLNDFLDGVNLVGSWDWDSTGNSNLIRLGDVLVDNDLTGNGTWDSNGDINVVFLDIDLWDNVGDLGSDSGVGSDWGSNLGLDNGVSGSRSSWDRCRGDGSIRCWGSWDGWRGKSNGLDKVLGSSGNIRSSRLGDGFLSSNGVSVSSNNLLNSSLDGPLSNNSVFNTVLNYWGSSSISMGCLSNNSWGRGHWGSNKTSSSIAKTTGVSKSSMSNKTSMGVVSCWGTIGTGHKGNSNTKSVHVSAALFRSNCRPTPIFVLYTLASA